MIVELQRLLRERQVIHPSTITSAAVADGTLRVAIAGHRWWREVPGPTEANIMFVFEGLSEGCIAASMADGDDEVLEEFSVQNLSGLSWAGPANHQVFCQGPIPSPSDLYSRLQSYLVGERAFWSIDTFLNCAMSLSQFAQLAQETSFLVARGPDAVRDLVCAELSRQSVKHNVLSHDLRQDDRLLVELKGDRFLCRKAWAEFD